MNSFPSNDSLRGPRWGAGRAAIAAAICLFVSAAAGCASSSQKDKEQTDKAAETPTQQKDEADQSAQESKKAEDETQQQSGASGKSMKVPKGESHPKIERGVQAAADGNYGKARNVLSGMTDNERFGHLADYNLAVIDEIEGKDGDAAKRYGQALEQKPDFTPALINLVRVYLRQGQLEEAESIARKYTNKRSENLDHRAALFEVKLARGQYGEVVRKAKSILRRDERNVEAMVAMAKANYWMERYELTQAILKRASELSPKRADIYFLFGLVAMANEENGRAISNFEKAIQYNGGFSEAYNNLGLLYDQAGDHEGAVKQFKAAITHYPDFKEAILNLGNAYKGLGELEKAEQKFQKVLEMDSDNANAYFNLGVLYLDAKVPGMDKIPRLKKSIEMLNESKRVARGQLPEVDPA
ncbi:MAG: tetratricopeptide repeat protein, partial [Bradymonadaceae bacterium]